MQRIFIFILKKKYSVVFVLLIIIAGNLTFKNRKYHQNKFIASTNWMVANILEWKTDIKYYFRLKDENEMLSEENKKLHHIVKNIKSTYTNTILDSSKISYPYHVSIAHIIKNSFSMSKNYLTIDKGSENGVIKDMGVISSKGIIGIVERVSEQYSIIQSILNTNSRINVGIKGSNSFGTLRWYGNNYRQAKLEDISRLVKVKVGDTIITAGMSHIFPRKIPVGIIADLGEQTNSNYYILNIDLFNDMSQIGTVYLIKNINRPEIKDVENKVQENEY